jgi:hypothetical protein
MVGEIINALEKRPKEAIAVSTMGLRFEGIFLTYVLQLDQASLWRMTPGKAPSPQ